MTPELPGKRLLRVAHMVPSLKGKLHVVGQTRRAWERSELAQHAPPLKATLARAFAGRFIAMQGPAAAACILLGFHGFLRATELFSVRVTDLTVINARLSQLRLHNTEIGQRLVVTEQVSIDDEWILSWTAHLKACSPLADTLVRMLP